MYRIRNTRNNPGIFAKIATWLLIMCIGCVGSTRHEVKAIAGTSVDLPCDVDFEACGEIHSVKMYKNGVRVYMYSNMSAVAFADGDLARPAERADFNLKSKPPLLHITKVYLIDEGIYKCETTFLEVKEHCAADVAYTSLITLAKPSAPVIRYDDTETGDLTRIGPFTEGMKLSLSCEASGGKPAAQVMWYNGSESMVGEYSEIPEAENTGRGVNAIDVTLTRADLHSRFECRAMNDALEQPLVNHVEVDVHVRPLTVDISGVDGPVTEGQVVTITCIVTGARPAATVEWLNGTEQISPAPTSEVSEEESGFTSTTRSTLTFNATRYDNGAQIKCRTTNKVLESKGEAPMEDSVTLDVYYKPVVYMKPSGNMAVNYSETVEIKCYYDANPMKAKSVVWLNGLDIVSESTLDEISDEDGIDTEEEDDELTVPSIELQKVNHDSRGTYSCRVTNKVGVGYSNNSLTLEVNYPPVMELHLEPAGVPEHENANVTMRCVLLTANPSELYGYMWYREDELLGETDEDEDWFILPEVDREDTANYSCRARNIYGWGKVSQESELIVQYAPGEARITHEPNLIIKGEKVKFFCSTEDPGQPPAEAYNWFRNDEIIEDEKDAMYEITNITLREMANFSCAAVNVVGSGEEDEISVEVLAPAVIVQGLPETHGALEGATDVMLTCQVECYPLCSIIWLKDNRVNRTNPPQYTIKQSEMEVDFEAGIHTSVVSTLTWNMTTSSRKKDQKSIREANNANYTCQSYFPEGVNRLGTIASSTTVFKTEFPPFFPSVKSKSSFDDSGLNFTEKQYHLQTKTCTADAWPVAFYTWIFNDDVIAEGSTIIFNRTLNREEAGTYTCIAANKHGNISKGYEIQVHYPPECTIEKRVEHNGMVVITFSVEASPAPSGYTWFFNNGSLEDGVEQENDEFTSTLKFREEEKFFGNYTCATENGILGVEARCSVYVDGTEGWFETLIKTEAKFRTAMVIGIVSVLAIAIFIACLVWKRRAEAKRAAGGPEGDRAFYENLPFHGLQKPPNKPFRPPLPDLEYADVDFPAQQPLNNNNPPPRSKKSKEIIEQVVQDVSKEPSPEKTVPVRPPRIKETRM